MNFFLPINYGIFGNDIVDLDDPDCSKDHVNDRFIQKICTSYEINFLNQISNFEEKYQCLWSFWSLKESAYKTFSRIYFMPNFRYKDFVIDTISKKIYYKNNELTYHVEYKNNYIFSLTFLYGFYFLNKVINSNLLLVTWIKELENKTLVYLKHSDLIRKYVNSVFFKLLNEETRIYRKFIKDLNIYMPPYLYYKKKFYPISLTHHGRYLMFTMAFRSEFLEIIKNHYSVEHTMFHNNFLILFDN